jgi:Lon protease-like protein
MQLDRGHQPRDYDSSVRIPEWIPLFPLPNVVFFPKTFLPLHIFEPRYREMLADAQAGPRCIGMVLLKDGWERDYYGNPPIFDVGCIGRLAGVEPLPDGRSNILLHGLFRFEVRDQLCDKSYRQARVSLKPDSEMEGLSLQMRAELTELLVRYVGTGGDEAFWRDWLRPDIDDEVLINNISAGLDVTPLEKQFLLEADSLRQRAGRILDLLKFELCEREGTREWD